MKKGGGKTRKSVEAENLLYRLFDIALPDQDQPTARLGFLHDQRTERKEVLPPIIGMLAVERRRQEREKKEEARHAREEVESAGRFGTVGPY